MIYFYFICLLLLVFFILFAKFTFEEVKQVKNFHIRLLIILFLTIIFKFYWGYAFFGLEYEDSYSFLLSGRQFVNDIYSSSFLLDGITIGSIDFPIRISTYGGHFITFPVYLSVFFKLFGYSENLIFLIQTINLFLILLTLSLFTKKEKYWILTPIFFCLAPIINIFGTTALSETFSSLICLSFLLFYFKRKTSIYCLIAFFLALICKRENIILIIIPLSISIITYLKSNKTYEESKPLLIEVGKYICLISFYFLFIQNIFCIELIEMNDISANTFSLSYFKRLFPIFISALTNFTYFGITFFLFIFLFILNLHKKTLTKESLTLTILFLTYLFLYSSHYRGYSFIMGLEETTEFSSFRYINNFYYIISLCITLYLENFKYISKKKKILLYSTISVLMLISAWETFSLRKYFNQIEKSARFSEVAEVNNLIFDKKQTCIVSNNILLYQITQPNHFNVCDIQSFNEIKNLYFKYYFLVIDNFELIKKRYNVDIDKEKLIFIKELQTGKKIYCIKTN